MKRLVASLFSGLGGLVLGCLPLTGMAEGLRSVPEYEMKAAYLYNFALLTSWPGTLSGPFHVCVFGQDEYAAALEVLQGKSVGRQPIQVVYLNQSEDAQKCQVVFLSDLEPKRAERLWATLRDTSALTVTDDKRLQTDAMIYLESDNRRLVFEVNMAPAKRAELTLSSKLLRLAKRVISP